MTQEEMCRESYQQDRYMRHLRLEELEARLHDLIVNYVELAPGRKLGLLPLDEGGAYWLQSFTELLEEFRLRFGDYPAGFRDGFLRDVVLPFPDHAMVERAAAAIARRPLKQGTFLAKYGTAKYLERTLTHGAILVRGASSYDDASLDPARRASELRVSVKLLGDKATIQIRDRVTNEVKATLPQPTRVTLTRESLTDFYVYCMSEAWKSRLFVDFNADACLIITSPSVFLNRLTTSVRDRLDGQWNIAHGPVGYFDPLRPVPREFLVGQIKDFRYAYQCEYRVMWLPPQPASRLVPLLVEIGNLEDCSEIITL